MSVRRFEISGTQVTASVLATVTGAIAASFLGVAGTIIGAAVMSVAGTAGSAFYNHYLGRTARRLRKAAPAIRQRAADRISIPGYQPSAGQPGDGDDGAPDDRPPPRGEPAAGGGRSGRPRWLLTAVATAGIFVGVIACITGFELAAGKPLAAVVWHRSGAGTSVGGGTVSTPDLAPSPRQSSPDPSPGTRSRQAASPSAHPSGTKTTSPASPSPSPTPSSGSPSPGPSPTPTSAPPSASRSASPAGTS